MGCHNSKVCGQVSRKKKKSRAQEGEKHIKDIKLQDGSGTHSSEENLLETYECQLKILHAVLKASGDQERDQLLKDHPGDICTLVHSIIEKVKTEITADLNDLHEKQTRSTLEKHQSATEELQRLHNEEKKILNDSHAAAENALKDQIEGLTSELKLFNELKRRAQESTLKRDLRRNTETHGSPGAFWEQEQESLLFVIEMKRERLQDQGNKLLQMQTLVEKNLSLEDQLLQALQQSEDYRVRIDNYQSLIQQLSKEQNELQEALEKQSLQNQKLSQEKEELLFKLIHRRDSCSSFHLPSVIPTQVSPS
ncbi:coiled-coil domain-containing protein 69-like [Cyprinus carpio]|uniref:Coiled-coil domain-containing protein 69-like n=1 Tax=Cyprinus carpio TaxID=7962 RepID=A0A9R0B8T6_CYPCA|nr:coiled-coil domain-containing protein 69-like [Cyprinus carpio]